MLFKKLTVLIIPILVLLLAVFLFNDLVYFKVLCRKAGISDALLEKQDRVYDVVNVGNSHARYGINYKDLTDTSGLNLALDSQDFQYDRAMLKQYDQYMDEDTVVVICISYFSFYNRFGETNSTARYYYLLNAVNNPNFKLQDHLIERFFPMIGINKLNIFLDDLHSGILFYSPEKDDDTEAEDMAAEDGIENEALEESAQLAYQRHLDMMDEYKETKQASTEDLYAMIAEQTAKGRRVVLVTTPFSDAYADLFKAEGIALDTFYEDIGKAQSQFGIEYLDYSQDPRFRSNKLYRDADHLNLFGAEKFTQILIEDIFPD